MFENDTIQAFQNPLPKRSKQPKMMSPSKAQSQTTDDFIMDTNNSSIVSKRSVEKLYWSDEPEYFRYFVNKFKRRSPLINRGYWLRMKAVETTVERFLQQETDKKKVVVNLGCGFDPLPWLFFGKRPAMCEGAVFVDVDYAQLMQKKVSMIEQTEQLTSLVPGFKRTEQKHGVLATSTNYVPVGCDLRDLDLLRIILEDQFQMSECKVAILFVAEVSTAYMKKDASDAVFEWAASYDDVQFCLLEQHLPDGADHPFAQTMLKHFEKLRTPLHAIGTMDEMKLRFINAGFPDQGVDIRSLWALWSDNSFLAPDERRSLDKVEPFDEWEEFALFGSHYFLLVATKRPGMDCIECGDEAPNGTMTPASSSLTAVALHNETPIKCQQRPTLPCYPLPNRKSHRRFAALFMDRDGWSHDSAALHAGQGTKERLTTCDIYSREDRYDGFAGPPLRTGLMCHTITKSGPSTHLLVGGRTSPEKASSDCWHLSGDQWQKTESLPQGRYRHCAIRCGTASVLVVGGKTSSGEVLLEPILWRRDRGWQPLKPKGSTLPAPRFGAVVYSNPDQEDKRETARYIMCGGMADDGTIHQDVWSCEIYEETMEIEWTPVDPPQPSKETYRVARFGAQCARFGQHFPYNDLQLVGGIAQGRMLTRDEEFLNLEKKNPYPLDPDTPRPLLVGFNLVPTKDGVLVLGGGATCFSFGTYWNDSCFLTWRRKVEGISDWQFRSNDTPKISKAPPKAAHEPTTIEAETPGCESNRLRPKSIPRLDINDPGNLEFEAYVQAGQPIIFTNANLGPCKEKWSLPYLKEAIGPERKVVVHEAHDETMDFQNKNFSYSTITASDFLDRVSNREKLYLRALSYDAPSGKPTNLATDFPSLAPDFQLPPQLSHATDNAHSSPLRISGPVNMWLHYDVMANILCQIRGHKRLLLFPPTDIAHLGFEPGASSSSLNLFAPQTPNDLPTEQTAHTTPHEALLNPGDVLFIPPLWLHTAHPTEGLSVAVNVFFRSWEQGYAAGRDVYGNRDLAAYEKGRKDVDKICKAFDGVDGVAARFYLERLGLELVGKARGVV
ncbi:hypothetical protein MBLNU230_g3049t1 [Neophaeotheca triangularis]